MHNVMCKADLVSPCRRIPQSEDFEILDRSYFEKTGCEIPIGIDELCIAQLPEGQNFFYQISIYDEDGSPFQSETGIGEIYTYGGDKTAFKREFASTFINHKMGSTRHIVDNKPVKFKQKTEYFVVSSYIPQTCREALVTPNSVLCSVERFDPTPVELEDNSVLGRLNDKIQSIDGAELRTILTDDRIVSAIKEWKKPLVLATNKFEVKNRLTCRHIYARPGSRPSKPQPGFLHYNDGLDCLEIFTSLGWRSVTTTPTS